MVGKDAQPLRLVTGRDSTGHAVAFPAHCFPKQGKSCPKQIIEVYPDTSIAPGTMDLEWGAGIRLERSDTAKGSNIIQKGFSLGGGSHWNCASGL